jgi:tRNA pseudouridine38-40 synthase
MFQHPVEIVGAGRTDSGVHALGQVISFRTNNPMPIERVAWVANRLLAKSIRVRKAVEKTAPFHARFSAGYRRYWYVIEERVTNPDPFGGRFRWQLPVELDTHAMVTALKSIVGLHDFATFCHRLAAPFGSTERTIYRAELRYWDNGVVIDIQADAFLHQMVRLLVSNLVRIGTHVLPVTGLADLIASRNRHLAGKGAPPHGLFLMRIGYPPTIDPRWGSLLEKLNNEELFG